MWRVKCLEIKFDGQRISYTYVEIYSNTFPKREDLILNFSSVFPFAGIYEFYFWVLLYLLFFSCSVVSDSLWPHGLQHDRPHFASTSPEVCPSSCPLHRWCHLTTSSSDALFSFCPQSFPGSGVFPMSRLFTSDDQLVHYSFSSFSPLFLLKVTLLIPKMWGREETIILVFVLCQGLKNILNLILTSTLTTKYCESLLTDKEISIQLFSDVASK